MAEQFGQTILATVQELEVCGEPQTVAATEIELNGESEPELERLEGMLVTFASPLTVTGNENLGVFGELVLAAGGRLFNPTDTIDPNEPDNTAVSAAADPFGFLRPWNELPALFGSPPPATPPSTGTGVVVCIMG
jgi:hypothetical protein